MHKPIPIGILLSKNRFAFLQFYTIFLLLTTTITITITLSPSKIVLYIPFTTPLPLLFFLLSFLKLHLLLLNLLLFFIAFISLPKKSLNLMQSTLKLLVLFLQTSQFLSQSCLLFSLLYLLVLISRYSILVFLLIIFSKYSHLFLQTRFLKISYPFL